MKAGNRTAAAPFVRGLQTVGVLFSAFGGFLTGLAPPEEAESPFAVGVSSFGALVILFLCAALSRTQSPRKRRKTWGIIAGLCLVAFLSSAYRYESNYARLTFKYPPDSQTATYVAGHVLTTEAREYVKQHPGLSSAQVLAQYGGLENREAVWPASSLRQARTSLTADYVMLTLSLSGAIFSLTEGFGPQILSRLSDSSSS